MAADVRTLLALDACRPDDRVQSRARLDSENVAYLRAILQDGRELTAIVVFGEAGRKRYWLASGFHRWHAHKQAGRFHIEADVREGGMRDAILYSVGCNDQHGLRRNSEDIQHAIRMLLDDPEWGQWSAPKIAKQCKVDQSTVYRHREKYEGEKELAILQKEAAEEEANNGQDESPLQSKGYKSARKYVNRYGDEGEMNVNGYAGPEGTPGNLFAKFADDQGDLEKLTKQMASSARKFWRFAYRVARLRGSDATVDGLLSEIIPEQMAWARQKEIEAHQRKHGA